MKLPVGKTYNFFIDDNIFFFSDIFRDDPASLFDHFYLNSLRKVYEKYGTVQIKMIKKRCRIIPEYIGKEKYIVINKKVICFSNR